MEHIQINNHTHIDTYGNLWHRGGKITDEMPHGWWSGEKRKQLDGGTIEPFRSNSYGVLLKHTDVDGKVWWNTPGTLSTPKDIDDARRLRAELDGKQQTM